MTSREQPDPVCVCGKTSEGVCRRCGQDMEIPRSPPGWHEDFGDSPSVEERPEYLEYLAREELREIREPEG